VPTAATDECEFVRTVREAIEEHLADPDLDVDRLADAVAVSRSTLYRRLKDEIGTPPSEFIRQVRLEHGARLLREEKGTVSEVAYAVGFSSLSYFSRSFREHVGQSPSEYANR
jgi:AraC-like DNA-binding protein